MWIPQWVEYSQKRNDLLSCVKINTIRIENQSVPSFSFSPSHTTMQYRRALNVTLILIVKKLVIKSKELVMLHNQELTISKYYQKNQWSHPEEKEFWYFKNKINHKYVFQKTHLCIQSKITKFSYHKVFKIIFTLLFYWLYK